MRRSLRRSRKGEVAALAVPPAPRLAIPLVFEREDGSKASVADFRGRAVLLNLWATWCVPCRAEMPALDRLQAEAGDKGFEVVAVNVDTARLERRGPFLDGIGVKSLARYADPSGDAFETLRQNGKALGLPVTMLIDKEGCEMGVDRRRRQLGFARCAGADRRAQGGIGVRRRPSCRFRGRARRERPTAEPAG